MRIEETVYSVPKTGKTGRNVTKISTDWFYQVASVIISVGKC